VTSAIQTAVKSAIASLGSTIGIGAELYVSSVEAVALAVPGVVSVAPGTTLNGVNADLTVSGYQEVHIVTSGVTVSTY
jgi:uncharacterized phage protein gp47/JayE